MFHALENVISHAQRLRRISEDGKERMHLLLIVI